jgi:type IV secretory pathway ATPase VirB11/archaellum biosynthesis ATPase
MLASHYAPRTPLVLIVGPPAAARARLIHEIGHAVGNDQRIGVVALEEDRDLVPPAARVEVVGSWSDPATSARRLFDAVRALDDTNLDVLFVRELADPSLGLGRALTDRLRRAARHVIDTRD